jgi:succinate-semialdehyde dehydrogenase/glutarate-semialdehyde dehydrogenase
VLGTECVCSNMLTAVVIILDPATGATIGSCPESDIEDVQKAIESAATALPCWRTQTNRIRSRILRRWHDLVHDSRADLAKLITLENGKATPDAIGEVAFANSFLEWYSEEAARIYGDVIPHSAPGFKASVLKEPIGVCGIIVPYVTLFVCINALQPLSYT